MVERVAARGLGLVRLVGIACALAACGRTTLLLSLDEGSGGGAAGTKGVTPRGGAPTGGTGPSVGSGGTFGGSFSTAGQPSVAGSPGAGTSAVCDLSPLDCRTEDEPECELANFPCTGGLETYHRYISSSATITTLATARDGRVGIAGSFVGPLDLGGRTQPLTADFPGGLFVAVYDRDGVVEWAQAIDGVGKEWPISIAFTSTGALVVQGGATDAPDTQYFVASVDEMGEMWRYDLDGAGVSPVRVAVDNNDSIWLGGSFYGKLGYRDRALASEDEAPFLLQLDQLGNALDARHFLPEGLASAIVYDLAVDDEDHLLMTGAGNDGNDEIACFVAKLEPPHLVTFTKTWRTEAADGPLRVVVDRKMRFTLARDFAGSFDSHGTTYEASGNGTTDVWLAQYTSRGELLWQRAFSSEAQGAYVTALSVDTFDNLLLLGSGKRLKVDDRVISANAMRSPTFDYAVKLRHDGRPIWLHGLDGAIHLNDVTADGDGRVWLGGRGEGWAWLDGFAIVTATEPGAILLKVSP